MSAAPGDGADPADPGREIPPRDSDSLGADSFDALRSEGDLNLSERRRAWEAASHDEETRAWLERDARVFLHQSLSTPCLDVLSGAEGAEIQNLRGERYLDFHGNSVHQVGFGHPRVVAAVERVLRELPFSPRRYTNRYAIELAERLVAVAPGDLSKVLFSPGGTSAMGIALKLARAATGRFKTLSLWESFHGASLDCISIGGEAIFRKGAGPLLPGTEHAPPFEPRGCPFRCGERCDTSCADYIDYVLEREGDVAAVIAETVRSTPSIPPPEYWQKVRRACDRHGTLLVLDEIPNGLGRTGELFACEHFGVVPDILVLGKGLGGGVFPLAAVLARPELDVARDRALGHYTHEKSPVACAAGLATLDVIEEEGLVERARTLGAQFARGLEALRARHAGIARVRGLGLLRGLELADPSPEGLLPASERAEAVLYACLSRGLSFKLSQGSILSFYPPLTLSDAELVRALAILDAALRDTSVR